MCTHSHPDHSPGRGPAPSSCACSAGPRCKPPIVGLPSAPTARAAHLFVPDRALADGERLTLAGRGLEGAVTHTLLVIHTPGHAANHLCLLLRKTACCSRATTS
jgi:recombination protein RecT